MTERGNHFINDSFFIWFKPLPKLTALYLSSSFQSNLFHLRSVSTKQSKKQCCHFFSSGWSNIKNLGCGLSIGYFVERNCQKVLTQMVLADNETCISPKLPVALPSSNCKLTIYNCYQSINFWMLSFIPVNRNLMGVKLKIGSTRQHIHCSMSILFMITGCNFLDKFSVD